MPFSLGLASCGDVPTSVSSNSTNDAPQSPATQPQATAEVSAEIPIVVATNGILCDLTQQIVQDSVDLTCLLEPGQDPHTFAPSPSAVRAIEEADLVLYGGYGFQPRIQGMIESSVNKVAVFEAAVPNPRMAAPHDHEHDDHGHADTHEAAEHQAEQANDGGDQVPDPHVWHDASYGAALVDEIAAQLVEIAPDQAELYQERATAIRQELVAIDQWIPAQINTVPQENRLLLTPHDAFGYYADAYGLSVAGALSGLSTEEKPSAARITEIVDQVKQAQVPAIFAEHTTSPELINTVARNAGVTVPETPLFVEGPGEPGTEVETYQEMLIANTCAIATALGGNCDRSSLQP